MEQPLPYRVIVCRFDKNLKQGSIVVGFNIMYNETGASLFIDTSVPLPVSEEPVLESDIVDSAWQILEPRIQAWLNRLQQNRSILGTSYIPKTQTGTS